MDILTISPPDVEGPGDMTDTYMQVGYFCLWRLSFWRTRPKWHSPEQPVIKSLKQSEVLVACCAGNQRVWSPAPSEHRICESPVSNSPTAVENSADHFGAFTMISSIPDNSSLPWPCFRMKAHRQAVFLVWVLACCREKWGTEVCKHLSAHPGAFFWLMLAETWRVIEIRNILNKFRGLPRQNDSQHQGLFFYLSPDNDLLGLDPIYCLFLPGCLCPVSHKSCLPDVSVFIRVSSVPWNGSPCQCTLPVVSHLVPLLWMYTVLHLLWTQETYQCVQRALLRHFGSLDISPLCILSKLSFTDALFRPVVCLPPLHGFPGHPSPWYHDFSWLSPCWFPATLPAGMQQSQLASGVFDFIQHQLLFLSFL